MGLPRGGPRAGAGRPKGVPNHIPRKLKEMILSALDASGGEAYLINVAKTDPKTFCQLIGRVLPLTVQGDEEQPLRHEHDVSPELKEVASLLSGIAARERED